MTKFSSSNKFHLSIKLALFAVLFLISGAAGLIYEIIWERILELYFGVTMTSITLIVAAYMAGLGLGSLIGGRLASRVKQTLMLYGIAEIAVGLFGAASLFLIQWIGQKSAGSSYPLVFVLSFALLLIPTFLMGMTLPLLTQGFVNRVETAGRVIGLLYGINTLGAALGALISGYFLIGWFGYTGTIAVAVAINILVGIIAIILSLRFQTESIEEGVKKKQEQITVAWKYGYLLTAAFLVGFIDLGFEMLWFRTLGLLNKNTAYNFPSILGIFLIGLALGGWLWGRKVDESKEPVNLFWKLQLGAGLVTAFSFLLVWGAIHFDPLQPWLRTVFYQLQQPISPYIVINMDVAYSRRELLTGLLTYFLPIIIIVLPASIMMGGGLPVLDRIAIHSPSVSGQRVGDIHLANILGSVLGSIVISFVFLNYFGTEITLQILLLLSLTFLLLTPGALRVLNNQKPYLILPAALVITILFLPQRGQFYKTLFERATQESVSVIESGDSVVALNINQKNQAPTWLWIGGVQNSYFPSDGRYERTAMTCAAASHPKRILIIGLGGGHTTYFATKLPNVKEIVVIELLPNIGPFVNAHVTRVQELFKDPRLKYIIDDGRRYLYAHPDEKFDMISIDPLNSFTAGHNNLYSAEAMALYQKHLTDNGVLCGWVNEEHILPNTAAHVFPVVEHFREFIVAGNHPLTFDRPYMDSIVKEYLNSTGIIPKSAADTMNPIKILHRHLRNHDQILAQEINTPILTDMNPWLEYYYFHAPIIKGFTNP